MTRCHPFYGGLKHNQQKLKSEMMVAGSWPYSRLMWLVATRGMSFYGECRLIGHVVVLGMMFYWACPHMSHFLLWGISSY